MEQIIILFFALTSFFGIENNIIAADKTTVTIHPQSQQIEIVQEDLFAIIRSEADLALAREQWSGVSAMTKSDATWAQALDGFTTKTLSLVSLDNQIQPQLMLSYSDEQALRAMGVWYDAKKNQFSVNHVQHDNLQTEDGKLIGNYWVFDGDETFSFTIEPFKKMPEKYQKFKQPLSQVLAEI
ncbi:hypothetical protein J3492_04660 [Psychrobacter sp. F1192]|uniref:Orphan protein n=1 Tax=Psychrobacter coccoides TaxID=2818440 RepID=A0ABS3NM62_9GAMM|nr:hypothetical protein [Psychrobacter coccoides]MBO1530502.1 hypothetical protein [Psychrobacter coccoides]